MVHGKPNLKNNLGKLGLSPIPFCINTVEAPPPLTQKRNTTLSDAVGRTAFGGVFFYAL